MTGKPMTALTLRARSAEWVSLAKAGDKVLAPKAAALNPVEERKSLFESIAADPDRYSKLLSEACGKLPLPVTLGIPSSWVLLRIIELPEANPQELRGMVELQVDKFSPFPADEATFAYEILDKKDGRYRLLMGAIPTKTADTLRACLNAASLPPKWIDINLLGWWRLLCDAGMAEGSQSRIFIILDDDACDMVVATGAIPVAVRSLSGLDELTPDDVAEEVARETVYTMTSLDLERSGEPLSAISVWHRGATTPESLLHRLREQFPNPVHATSLDTLPPLAEGILRRSLDRQGTMDLAPASWQLAESAHRARRRIIQISVSLFGIWALGMATLFGGLQYQKQRLGRLQTNLEALTPAAENARMVRERVRILHQYIERKYSALECFREIADLLPPGITLKSINYRKAKNLELTGEADAVTLIYDFKKELEKSQLFVKTDLTRVTRTAQGKEVFKLTATLPGGEQP
jgi:Tfp pilus assembly protein PilN